MGGEELLLLEWPLEVPALPEALSPARRAVAELVLSGHSNAEIARRRRTSVRTVANQVAGIFDRLGVRSRQELFAWAARQSRQRSRARRAPP